MKDWSELTTVERTAVAIFAKDFDVADEQLEAAVSERTAKPTAFDIRNVLRDVTTGVVELYRDSYTELAPDQATVIKTHFAELLTKHLDAVDRQFDELLTVEQASGLIAIGKQTIRRYVQDNNVGEFNPAERRYLVNRRRLRNYLRDRRGSVPDRV